MGMYTELILGVELKKETPEDVINVLKYMVGNKEDDSLLSDKILKSHPFFDCDRWRYLLTCDSYYFDGQTHSEIAYDDISKTHYLTTRSNLKNYDSEIDLFLKFIEPYVTTFGTWGYKRYEESEMPTIIFKDDRGELKLLQVGDSLEEAYKINIKEEVRYNISSYKNDEENQKWQKWL